MRNLPKHYLGYYIQIKWAAISRAQFVEGLGTRNVPGRSEKDILWVIVYISPERSGEEGRTQEAVSI